MQDYESIKRYHKNNSKIPFEEKVYQLIELQKISVEMARCNPNRKQTKAPIVWEMSS